MKNMITNFDSSNSLSCFAFRSYILSYAESNFKRLNSVVDFILLNTSPFRFAIV
jgi:hypothetical protein